MTLSSHEDEEAWKQNFSFVKERVGVTKFRMADGAWEITNAMDAVYEGSGTRLMCWAHVYRNVRPKLAGVRKENKDLGEAILADIESIQWMAQTESEFHIILKLLMEHYLRKNLTKKEMSSITLFFKYFMKQWGPGSHVQNWYAGAHPFFVASNQGLEGTHKALKKEHTFRSELPMGQFVQTAENLVRQSFPFNHNIWLNLKLLYILIFFPTSYTLWFI